MRVAVTGCTSDFGTAILPTLFADPEIEEVVGTGRTREPRVSHPKLHFERHDVRSRELERCFAGCDVVVHLAFVVEELHDKELTHDVNLRGTENVIRCAHAAGAKRVVIASSVSAYGVHDWPEFVSEDVFPRGNHDRYYFYDKAEVEHFVQWWAPRHPETKVCLLRPPFVIGPSLSNTALSLMATPVLPYPDPERSDRCAVQMLHESDLARAFHLAVKCPIEGAYNITSDDRISVRELARIHGGRLIPVPLKPVRRVTDLLWALRLSPGSGDWVATGEANARPDRFRRDTGWSPEFSSHELAHVMLLHQGRGIVRRAPELHRHEVAEAALEPATRAVARWCDELPELRSLTGGSERFEAALARADHVFLDADGATVHVEVHRAEGSSRGTVLITPGPGAHARLYAPVAAALAERDVDVAVLDLPGHGLSTGRRGDAPPALARRAVDAARRYAEQELAAPLRLVHRGEVASGARWPSPLLAVTARTAARAPVPLRALLRRLDVSLPAYAADHLAARSDPLTCRTITARTAVAHAQADPEAIARELSFASPLPRSLLAELDIPEQSETAVMATAA